MPFLPAFLADDRLRAYVRAGRLELVLWDHLGECEGPPHIRCWQPLLYSHALLEAWGAGHLLLISDIDEYFVSPMVNSTLAGHIQKCGYNHSMARSRSRPARMHAHTNFAWHMRSSGWAGCPHLCNWRAAKDAAPAQSCSALRREARRWSRSWIWHKRLQTLACPAQAELPARRLR